MKKIMYTALAIALAFSWASCSDSLDNDLKLNIDVMVDGTLQNGNVIEVKKGTPIKFEFLGNPDFISFYSGESGYDYNKRFETELSTESIDSELRLFSNVEYGNPKDIKNSMRIFISTDFPGLTRKNVEDQENVNKYPTWKEITEEAKLATKSGETTAPVSIPLNEYFGKEITFAFWYCPHDEKVVQPRWVIHDFSIVNTDKKSGDESRFLASSMSFTPFDEKKSGADAYKYTTENKKISGIWNFRNINFVDNNQNRIVSQLEMHSTGAGEAPLNSVWLISKAIKVNSKTPDKGVAIKTMTDRVEEYTYTYNAVGEYPATFVVTNGNFEHESRMLKEYTIKIVE